MKLEQEIKEKIRQLEMMWTNPNLSDIRRDQLEEAIRYLKWVLD